MRHTATLAPDTTPTPPWAPSRRVVRRKNRQVKALRRAPTPRGAGRNAGRPGSAVLRTAKRTITSKNIVSQNARVIRNIYQTPAASTISVEFENHHNLTVFDTISIRADGHDGYTKRAHMANGDDKPITVVDDYTVILQGSVFIAGSVFRSGIAYTGQLTVDASAEIQRLILIGEEDGNYDLSLPAGVLALLTQNGINTLLVGRTGCTISGAGEFSTYLFAGDFSNGHVLVWYGRINVTLRDLTIYGNRQYQAVAGYHGTRFGSDAGELTNNIRILRVRYLAIAGYGAGFQSDGSFAEILIDGCTFWGCDSDGHDVKNRTNLGGKSTCTNSTFKDCGLYVQGVNFNGVTLGANPITTDSGTPTIIYVAHSPQQYAVGITVTLTGATSFNGIDFSGQVAGVITSRSGAGYYLDITDSGQSANASGSGGGSAVVAYGGRFSRGDAFFDTRGNYWTCSNLHFEGDFQARSAIRARKGHSYANDSGASKSTFTGITIKHTGPVERQGVGISMMTSDCVITGVTGTNLSRVVSVFGNVIGGTVTGVIGIDCARVIADNGENMTFIACEGKGSTESSFYVDGGTSTDEGELDVDPFTTTAGSSTVTVEHNLHAHSTGNSITYRDVEIANNVDLNGTFVVTVTDANHYTITASTLADTTGDMGGENVTYEWSGSVHNARLTKFIGCTSIGSTLGYEVTGQARDVLMLGCSSYGDTTAYSDTARRATWKACTGGLPNDLANYVDLPLDGTPLYLTSADSGKTFYLPVSGVSATAVVYLAEGTAHNRGLNYRFMNGNATYGIEVRLQGTGTIRYGSTSSTVGFETAATGAVLDVEFREVTGQRWMVPNIVETWTAL